MLDALFGKEEEFDYGSTAPSTPPRRDAAEPARTSCSRRCRRRPVGTPAGRPTDYDRTMAVTTPATDAAPARSRATRRSASSTRCARASRARGAAGSTFDHVAREAGVSRGLLHYYFGTKERLLVEVVRRDSEIRLAALAASLGDARTADDFIDAIVRSLEQLIGRDPGFVVLMHELFTLSRRNEEIAGELATLARARARRHRRPR